MPAGLIESQMTRYGAIAKHYPLTTGKVFFLMNSTEAQLPSFNSAYPTDGGGQVRVYTTWASVISAIQATADADVVMVSPAFTTAPTLAQVAALDAAGVVTMQMGGGLPDGSYIASRAAATLPQGAAGNLFQVNGRIELLNILGEVTTVVQTQANNTKLQIVPTVGATVDLCSVASISAAAVGTQLSITGTLATALQITASGALVRQAAPLVVTAGNIALNCAASSTGAAKWRLHYKPLDPGAFVSAL